MLQDIREQLFFDGKIKFTTGITVYGHGHCINSFGIIDSFSNEEIIPMITFFHLEKIEEKNDVLQIGFRIYPEGKEYYEIQVDPFQKIFKYKHNIYPTSKYYKIITGSGSE